MPWSDLVVNHTSIGKSTNILFTLLNTQLMDFSRAPASHLHLQTFDSAPVVPIVPVLMPHHHHIEPLIALIAKYKPKVVDAFSRADIPGTRVLHISKGSLT